VYGEETAADICSEDNQTEAESAGGEAHGGGHHEPTPPLQTTAAVGRIRVSARDDTCHGAVSQLVSTHMSFYVINASFSLYLYLLYVRFHVNATVTVIVSCQVSVLSCQLSISGFSFNSSL